MDLLLDNVKEKGIVYIIEEYSGLSRQQEAFKECMRRINNLQYRIINKRRSQRRRVNYYLSRSGNLYYVNSSMLSYVHSSFP